MIESTVIGKKSLSKKLACLRCDRPDEWTMDEFMRDAKKLEVQVLALQSKLDEIDKQEPIAWLAQCKTDSKLLEIAWPRERATNKHCWSDAFPVFKRFDKS